MGSSALRQLLRSVCSNSEWKYAVLWKIRHGNPTILSWEDGYIDCQKPRQVPENLYCNSASDASELSSGSVGLVVSELSQIQYALGEGLVGQVAFTGNHSWVSSNDIFQDEGDLNPGFHFPEEWLLQFATGIKTILLVPLLPFGVLQLGSLEEVAEDTAVVASLKGRFDGFHNVRGNSAPVNLKRDVEDMSSYSTNKLRAPPAISLKPVKSEDPDPFISLDGFKPDIDNIIPGLSQLLPLLAEQHVSGPPGNDLLEALKYDGDNEINGSSPECTGESIPLDSLNSCEIDLCENKMFELSSLIEELQSYSEFTNYNLGLFGEPVGEIAISHADEEATGMLYREDDADYTHFDSFLNFPPDSELHKALGPAFWEQSREMVWNPSSLVDGTHWSTNSIWNQRIIDVSGPSWAGCRAETEYLLDAVVSNAHGGSDDISGVSYNCKLSPNPSGYLSTAPQLQKSYEKGSPEGNYSECWKHIMSECTVGDKFSDASSATLKSMMSTIRDKEQQKGSHLQGQKGQKTSNISKRKTKPGDSQKPRPRDRQLIQDRVKELRELVPNGGKCSIDSLLDRTIKHMTYLRGVTTQAEKLKQWALQEVADRKNRRSATETANSLPNGTSWAFEVGGNPQMCPIVVEDLPCPGHMLIEMLCNEHSLFLEIAQVIRGSELTILKGVMESRQSQSWAHFIVEASPGFHRLDIFWPLMQLLQRKRPISSKI